MTPAGPRSSRFTTSSRASTPGLGECRAHPEAAEGLFRISQDLHWNTPLVSRGRADIARFFDGFTLVEPGLVRPAQWRPDMDNPLRAPRGDAGGDAPVLRLPVSEPPEDDQGAAWHLCGVGLKS